MDSHDTKKNTQYNINNRHAYLLMKFFFQSTRSVENANHRNLFK